VPKLISSFSGRAILAAAALSISVSAEAGSSACPKWEAGTRYPWQSNQIFRGDLYAWVKLDVDRGGYPVRCKVAANNYPDPESRVWLCKQYYDRWRGPAATTSDPPKRSLERFSLVPSPKHEELDRKARAPWFQARPEERLECYPEPSRPDRMDL